MILKALACVIVLFALWVATLWLFQRGMLYYPDKSPAPSHPVFRDITALTEDGLTLKAWYAPARDNKHTVVLFHGNGGSFFWRAEDFMPLVDAGYGVLLAEYRGYGGNPGKPSEAGLYHDAESWLASLDVPRHKIVLYGESLGTGPAIEMALRHPDLGGIVLENPYTSMGDLAATHYSYIPLVRHLVRDHYRSIDKIADVSVPKLFLIADRDQLVPPDMGRALYEAAINPKMLKTYPAGHNDIRAQGVMNDVLLFLDALSTSSLAARPMTPGPTPRQAL